MINRAKSLLRKTATALVVLGAAAAAQAGTITFTNFSSPSDSDAVDYVVTISDLTSTSIWIDVAVAPLSTYSGSITGVAFDLEPSATTTSFDASALGLSITSSPAHEDLEYNTDKIGGANLSPYPIFDVFLSYNKVSDVELTLTHNGSISLSDFVRFGVRAQETNGPAGSSKAVSTTINIVPLPPSAWMGLGLLGVLGVARIRRRRRSL